MAKHPAIEHFLENLSRSIYGASRINCIAQRICVCCGKSAASFKDELSEKEFTISALCQDCQDGTFIKDEDEFKQHSRD